MAVILREMIRNYKLYVFELSDQRTIDWPLMRTPFPVLAIFVLYLWFVLKIGPDFMKNRQPFNLDRIIQVYNLVQVAVCGFVAANGIAYVYGPWGHYSFLCQPIDFSETEFSLYVVKLCYIYFLLKILDLLDTVFFILRKKQSQVTFLHVYHHSLMVLIGWTGMRFVPGGHAAYLGIINSFVHAVMYAYYFLTNYNKEYRKNVWWKKYITQLQLFQFLSVFLHMSLVLVQPNCVFPKLIIYILIPQNFFIFLLFLDFYVKSYVNPKPIKTTE